MKTLHKLKEILGIIIAWSILILLAMLILAFIYAIAGQEVFIMLVVFVIAFLFYALYNKDKIK